MLLSIISKISPVIILFIIGQYFKISGYLSPDTLREIKKLVVNLFLPSLIFLSFSQTNVEYKHLLIALTIFVTCGVLLFIGYGLKKVLKVNSKYYPLLFTGFEAGMLGYSIFTLFYGTENVFKFALIDLGQVTFVFFVMVGILTSFKDTQKQSFKNMSSSFIKTPVIIAIILGIIFQKTGLINLFQKNILLSSFLETLRLLANITVPMIALVIGYELGFKKKNLPLAISTVILRHIILLILAFILNETLILRILHLDKVFQSALFTMFILPAPFIIPLYMRDEDKEDAEFIASVLALNTISTLILFIFVNYFLT